MTDTDRSRRELLQAGGVAVGLLAVGQSTADESTPDSTTVPGLSTADEAQTTAAESDWPQFQADARNSGTNETTGPTDSVEVVWSASALSRPPAVVDGTVYTTSDDLDAVAIDARTGDRQWTYEKQGNPETGDGIQSPPAVSDGIVFVGNDVEGVPGLDAIAADKGERQWRSETHGSVLSAPTVMDGTVYLGAGQYVHALEATTGDELWSFETEGDVANSPAVVDGTVYFASADGNVYAVEATTSTEQWRYDTGLPVDSSPTVVDGTVYVGSGDRQVYALDSTTGNEKWAFETDAWVSSSPAVADDTVYVGSKDNSVYALDASEGTKQWSTETGDVVTSSPALVDGTVYVESGDGTLYALEATTGDERWTFELDRFADNPPVVADGTLYTANDGTLYALADRVESDESASNADVTVTKRKSGEQTETDITVEDASAGDTVTASVDLEISDALTQNQLTTRPAVDGDFELSLTSSSTPLDSTPAVPILSSEETLGYLSVDETIAEEDIEEVLFRYTVDTDRVEALDDDPDEMALYRYEDDTWVARHTELVSRGDGSAVYETTAPGFSEWTAGARRPDIEISSANVDVSVVEVGDEFDIDVVVTNNGDADGVYVTELLLEDEVVVEKRPTVPRGESVPLTFTRSLDKEGQYTVRVNDVKVEMLTVSDGERTQDESSLTDRIVPLVLGGTGIIGTLAAATWYRWQNSGD